MWPFRRARGRDDLGRRGERLAARLLRRRGMKVLARNYRCPAGEADLIALDRSTRGDLGCGTLAFVEVKTRSSDRYVGPESAVDSRKRRRLERIADCYLATHDAGDFAVRFDIVAVVLAPGAEPQITYLPDAF